MNRLSCALLAVSALFAGCGDDAPTIEYDREVNIPDLDGEVSAFYDVQGVLSLRCQSDADCLAAQGYFHAADRFFQMDLRRRFARGRLSELAGPIVLDFDHQSRTLIATKDGKSLEQQMWDAATPETQLAVEAYTRGVNAWIEDLRNDRNGARLSAEYDFMIIDKTVIDDWEALDSIACFLPIIDQLTNHSARDLRSGEAMAKLGAAKGNDLYGLRVPSASTVLPGSSARTTGGLNPAGLPDFQKWLPLIQKARAFVGPARATTEVGSNNWIVSPDKGGGKALLANDPHLSLSNPAIWYMVHIDAKSKGTGELHIAGASFPGMPGVVFGQNENLAWGVTTTFFDQSDVYLETLNEAGDAVIFNGTEVPILEVEQEYLVSGGEPQTRIARYVPHHGPILSIDTTAGTATSLRWSAQDADTDFNFLWKMWTSTTTEEARIAIEDITSVGQNFVVADKEGDIGWYPYNRIPERSWMATTPSWLPLPGDGSAEWGAYLDYADLPQSTNPAAGFLATANNDMTGSLFDGDPSNDGVQAVQAHVAAGYRHERIVQLLDASEALTLEDMQAIQHDHKSLYGQYITPLLLADAAGATLSMEGQAVLDALSNWDFYCPTGYTTTTLSSPEKNTDAAIAASAKGCAAFHVLWPRLRRHTFSDDMAEAGANFFLSNQPMANAFLRPEALSQEYWDKIDTADITETRADIVALALDDAGAELRSTLGADTDDWRWGALHSVYLPADLFDQAGVTEFSHGPLMHDGGISTVDVAQPRNDLRDDYSHSHGASIRLTCEIDEGGPSCFYQLPGGQRHHRADAFYNSLLDNWLAHLATPLPFSIKKVIELSVDTIKVQ